MNHKLNLKMLKRKHLMVFLVVFLTGFIQQSFAQGVKIGDNPSSLNASALLELQSTKAGLLLPRMNTVQMNAIQITPGSSTSFGSNGLVIYNTDSACVCYYNGSAWKSLCNVSPSDRKKITAQGFIKVNGTNSVDSAVLKPVLISVDTAGLVQIIADSVLSTKVIVGLSKVVGKSPLKDSITALIKRDTSVTNNIIKVIKDSVTVNKTLKDSIFSAVKANGKTLTTDGLVLVNGATSLDSALLKAAKLTLDSGALAKAIVQSPIKDSIASLIKKDTGVLSTIVKTIKDSVTVNAVLRDSVFSAVKANGKKLTSSGLIKVNGGTALDSTVLKPAYLTVDTIGLTQIIADSIASSKTVLDSLAKGLTKSPVKDTLLSLVKKDTAFTNNIIKVIKDSVTVNKTLKDSIFSAVKANGKTLTTDGLVLVNGATSLDSALLKAAKLTLDSSALAKAIVQSPIKDSIASLVKKDTGVLNTIVKTIKDSVTVNKTLQDSVFSAVKANGKKLTSSGLIKVNGGTALDSTVLKPAYLTVDTLGLTQIIADSIASSKTVLDSLAKGLAKSPVKDTLLSLVKKDTSFTNNIIKVIKDSVTVNKTLKDSIFSAVKANGKTLTTDGLVLVNGATSLDSALLKAAKLTLDSSALAKAIVISPIKDSIASLVKKDTGVLNTIVKTIKDSVTVNKTLQDSVFSAVKANGKKLTSSGLIRVNGGTALDSTVLKPAYLTVDTLGLTQIIADSIASSKTVLDSLAKGLTKSPVKDTLLSLVKKDTAFTNNIIKVIKDSVTVNKTLKDSIFSAVKANGKTLTTDGLVLVNGATSLDSALLKSAKLTLDSGALAKAIVKSPIKDSIASLIKKDTGVLSTIVKTIKDSVTVNAVLRDSVFSAIKAKGQRITTSGLIKVNGGTALDSSVLKSASFTVDTLGLTQIIADSIASSKTVLDSLAKGLTKSPVKDTLLSLVKKDTSFTNNIIKVIKDSVTVNKTLKDSIFSAVKANGKTLTTDGLVLVNGATSLDSALLKAAKLTLDSGALAKAIVQSPIKDSIASLVKKDTGVLNTIVKVIKDSVTVNKTLQDSVFSAVKAKGQRISTSGLIKVNGGTALDSSVLKAASFTVDTAGLTKIIADSIASSKTVLDSLAKGLTKSPVKDTINSIIDTRIGNNAVQYTLIATDVNNGFADIAIAASTGYTTTAKLFVSIETDNLAVAVSIGRSNRTASSVRVYFGAAALGDKINLLIVK